MFKRMLAMLPTGLFLTLGCATKTEPVPGPAESAAPGKGEKVVLYVEGMIERQNIT